MVPGAPPPGDFVIKTVIYLRLNIGVWRWHERFIARQWIAIARYGKQGVKQNYLAFLLFNTLLEHFVAYPLLWTGEMDALFCVI